jgi:hypothetical protein
MTAMNTAPDTVATTSADHDTERFCASCSHSEQAHDPTALRFCQATLANQLGRNCICHTN